MDDSVLTVLSLMLGLAVFGPLGAVMMNSKGRTALGGYLLCAFLGIIGIIIVAFIPKNMDELARRQRELLSRAGLSQPVQPPQQQS